MPLGAGRSLHLLHPCLAEHEQTYHCRFHKAIAGAGRTFSSILTKPAESLSSLDLPAPCSCGADQPAPWLRINLTSAAFSQAGRISLPPAAAVRINLHPGCGSTCSQVVSTAMRINRQRLTKRRTTPHAVQPARTSTRLNHHITKIARCKCHYACNTLAIHVTRFRCWVAPGLCGQPVARHMSLSLLGCAAARAITHGRGSPREHHPQQG